MEDRAVRLIAAATIIAIALGAALVWVSSRAFDDPL